LLRFQGGTNVYTFNDTFDMIRGRHDIRVGIGIRLNQMNVMTNGFQDGYFLVGSGFTGDNAADLLLGQPYGAIHDQTFYGATLVGAGRCFDHLCRMTGASPAISP